MTSIVSTAECGRVPGVSAISVSACNPGGSGGKGALPSAPESGTETPATSTRTFGGTSKASRVTDQETTGSSPTQTRSSSRVNDSMTGPFVRRTCTCRSTVVPRPFCSRKV